MRKTIIIAEAGVNHNGDIELAKKLINTAKNAGADYVKFQMFKAEKLVSPDAKKANYQIANIGDDDYSQFAMLKGLEMNEEWHILLNKYATEKGIKFASTGFDEESIDFLETLNPDFIKIPSGEITNKPYLQHIAQKGRPVILSTGMSDLEEIKQALKVLNDEGLSNDKITVLHCNTEYPTPMQDVNLLAMDNIAKATNVNIGYSDHTLGIEVPIAAVALGASVIEKHFTLDRNMPGPDHQASLEPEELKNMVNAIRNIELAVSGNGTKEVSESEKNNTSIARKSIHVNRDMEVGEVVSKTDLIMLRPGNGISPMNYEAVINNKLLKGIKKLSILEWNHIK
jgi:N,N'-diacetyllegionaminate synthase